MNKKITKIPKKVQKVIGKGKKITPDLHHKVKVQKRKQEIAKHWNDIENKQIMPETFEGTHPGFSNDKIKGYKPKKVFNIYKFIFKTVGLMVALLVGFMLLIVLLDIWLK